jgi:hypothetical protein
MDLKVPYSNVTTKDEAFDVACAQITEEYIAKFNVKADVQTDKAAGTIVAKGKGFKLALNFKDDGVELSSEFGLLLRAFKGKVLETIERKLQKYV